MSQMPRTKASTQISLISQIPWSASPREAFGRRAPEPPGEICEIGGSCVGVGEVSEISQSALAPVTRGGN
jgi:hypothetical protein